MPLIRSLCLPTACQPNTANPIMQTAGEWFLTSSFCKNCKDVVNKCSLCNHPKTQLACAHCFEPIRGCPTGCFRKALVPVQTSFPFELVSEDSTQRSIRLQLPKEFTLANFDVEVLKSKSILQITGLYENPVPPYNKVSVEKTYPLPATVMYNKKWNWFLDESNCVFVQMPKDPTKEKRTPFVLKFVD